jgi:hypothetical protein
MRSLSFLFFPHDQPILASCFTNIIPGDLYKPRSRKPVVN